MKPDFLNNLDSELPKPATPINNDSSINKSSNETINPEPNKNLEFDNISNDSSLGNDVFGFNETKPNNDILDMEIKEQIIEPLNVEAKEDNINYSNFENNSLGSVTVETPKEDNSQLVETNNVVQPPIANKKNNVVVTIVIVLVGLALVIFGVYQGLTYFTNKKPETTAGKDNNNLIIDTVNDAEVYKDKIITVNPNFATIFTSDSESIYLFTGTNQKLHVMVGNLGLSNFENAQGLLVTNLENLTVKSIFQTEGCKLADRLTYVLMSDGSLYYFDLNKGYAELYTILKNPLIEQKVTVSAEAVVVGSPIKSFTSIVTGKNDCTTYGIYVLTDAEKPEIKKIDHKSNGVIAIGERYKGHVNYIGNDGVDYFVYADKTIGNVENILLVDKNNQNHKFEKVIYGKNQIEELKASYALIGTDNKLYYSVTGSLLDLKTNDKTVTEVVESTKPSIDQTMSYKSVLVKYSDNTIEVLSSIENDLNIINIQDLIDNPIN